ncbi:hypothetical protein BPS26883_06439 [Burkholderia pseudomultivorans]|uniref:Uncharacterized protein n=1 Tax=Burkholderia pseudomultivorans TaxID=1207504 RepID=A0A6P2R9R1_9BURK|nr:hypothetical protein BPS26883_06439 [Burkholderia pseudomultivorans]
MARLAQRRQRIARMPVRGDDVAAFVERDQPLGLRLDVVTVRMPEQYPVLRGAVHEIAVLDQRRALSHELIDEALAVAAVGRLHGRRVEHADQFAARREDRRRAAGQRRKRRTEMIGLVHGDRRQVGQHARDAAGAFLALRPARADMQPRVAEIVAALAIDPVVDRHAVRVGQHHAVVGHANHVVQPRQALAGRAQERFLLVAHLAQLGRGQHARPDRRRRVEPVALERALPRRHETRRIGRRGQASGERAQHTVGMLGLGNDVGHGRLRSVRRGIRCSCSTSVAADHIAPQHAARVRRSSQRRLGRSRIAETPTRAASGRRTNRPDARRTATHAGLRAKRRVPAGGGASVSRCRSRETSQRIRGIRRRFDLARNDRAYPPRQHRRGCRRARRHHGTPLAELTGKFGAMRRRRRSAARRWRRTKQTGRSRRASAAPAHWMETSP